MLPWEWLLQNLGRKFACFPGRQISFCKTHNKLIYWLFKLGSTWNYGFGSVCLFALENQQICNVALQLVLDKSLLNTNMSISLSLPVSHEAYYKVYSILYNNVLFWIKDLFSVMFVFRDISAILICLLIYCFEILYRSIRGWMEP